MTKLIKAGSGKIKKKLKTVKSVSKKNDCDTLNDMIHNTEPKSKLEQGFVSPFWQKVEYENDLKIIRDKGAINHDPFYTLSSKFVMTNKLDSFIQMYNLFENLFSGCRFRQMQTYGPGHDELILTDIPKLPEVEMAYLFIPNVHTIWNNGVIARVNTEYTYEGAPKSYNLNLIFKENHGEFKYGLIVPLFRDNSRFEIFSENKFSEQQKSVIDRAFNHIIMQEYYFDRTIEWYRDGYFSEKSLRAGIIQVVKTYGNMKKLIKDVMK